MSARIAQVAQTGGPERIHWHDVELPAPGPGEARVRNTAVGLNFIDIYHRSGVYPIDLPGALGVEGAGIVEAVGAGVTGIKPGDRVAYFGPDRGAYATARNMAAAALFVLPADIDAELAAAVLLKGCTAEFLVRRCARVEAGWPVLVHAAAGGVGMILTQWLKAVGATVIGTVGSEAKATLAREAGADHVIRYDREGIADRVRALTGGAGVRMTFDGIGAATWEASLDATGKRGLIIGYGNASGPVTGVATGVLALKGSLYTTRPMLYDYYAAPEERAEGTAALWDMIRSGKVCVTIGQRYPLEDAARAHRDLAARATHGSSLLIP
ncbi:MAG: quinone oxidoreductase [Novosphingobium sp.]